MAEYLGLRPTWVDSTEVGGATWEFMVGHAVAAMQAGQAEAVVLVYGSTTRADLKAGRRRANLSFGSRGPTQFDAPWGHTLIAKYAMATSATCTSSARPSSSWPRSPCRPGTTPGSTPTPTTGTRSPSTRSTASAMIADPFTKLHCCIRSDGGGAVVLATEERAADCAKAPVWVLGHRRGHLATRR